MKLIPATKDYLWGGTKLKEEYGIKSDREPVAEAWVLSDFRVIFLPHPASFVWLLPK